MEILSYLTELVRTRKEVGIAGLGTFYKKKSPGRYDAQTHSFLPPSHTLEFTEEVKENSALAAFVSKKKNISFDSSAYFIAQFAGELLKQLGEESEADLGELGSLSRSENGIVFSPSESADFGFEFYGLPSLKEQADPQEEAHAREQEEHFHERLDLEDHNADLSDGTAEPDEQPVYDEISEVRHDKATESPVFIETAEDLEEESAGDALILGNEELKISEEPAEVKTDESNSEIDHATTEAKTDHYWNFDKAHNLSQAESAVDQGSEEIDDKPKTHAYLWFIIAGVILLAVAAAVYFVKPGLFKGEVTKEQTKSLVTNPGKLKIDSAAKSDSILRTAQTAVPPQDSLKDTVGTVNPALPVVDNATTWEVIGASVINQKEADWFITQMKSIGITAKVIPKVPGKRRIKISVATFQDEASAMKGRKELVLKLKNPELYIYQNKHTNTQIK